MQNIIAIIWDFDKTLVDGYMQDPIFKEYGVDASAFWKEVNALPQKYKEEGVKINPDTIYLNQFINYVRKGIFKGLNNAKLRGYGAEQKFYPGIPEIFKITKELLGDDSICKEYNIRVEHYIVSTGFAEVIKGTSIMEYVEYIWGCELIEHILENGEKEISEIGYTIDNTTKTRALFEINKGINIVEGINVNSKLSDSQRRVDFKNMIYIADGPSDVPAFSAVKERGGATFAIYPKGDIIAFKQVEKLRQDGRIDMFAEADYSKDTTAYMWICNKIREFAERTKETEKNKRAVENSTPKHLV
jgi:phosphoserine phosphatase